jgi:hypothetical protein
MIVLLAEIRPWCALRRGPGLMRINFRAGRVGDAARRPTRTLDQRRTDPSIHATAIGVAVKDGVVTLTGHIDTYAEKYAAEKALRRVSGVKAIALEFDVRLSPQHRRSDTEIAAAAEQALRWNTTVPEKIRLTVDKG